MAGWANPVAAIVSLGVGMAGLYIALRSLLSELARARKRGSLELSNQPTIEKRVDQLAVLLRDSTTLLEELTAEMEARAATVEQMKAEAKHAERLAEIHKEHQEAVARLLRAELARQGRRTFWEGAVINLAVGGLFFIAGVFATFALS